VRKEERQAILGQGATKAETPRERRQRQALAEDVASSPLAGQPLQLRLRNFRAAADGYLASLGGPLPYMLRLREIDEHTATHAGSLETLWRELAVTCPEAAFVRQWREIASRWSFEEVNDLIDRHNRWYPAESRLPMDPRTGDYALVNGEDYRKVPLDAEWALARYPADRRLALDAGETAA
jgi:hypothetical protein